MSLHLDAHVARAERADDAIDEAADAEARPAERGAPHQRHQPVDLAVELLERERALPFRRSQLHPRDQPAQVAIALARFDQHAADRNTERRGRQIAIVNSAPMIALIPARLAARWKRGAP